MASRRRLELLLTGSKPVFLPLEDLEIMAEVERIKLPSVILETNILSLYYAPKMVPTIGIEPTTY